MNGSDEVPGRGGVNVSEAALLWAVAACGGDSSLLAGVEPGPAANLRPTVEEIEALAPDERASLAEAWRRDDETGAERPRWEPTAGASFDWVEDAEMRRGLRGIFPAGAEESSGEPPAPSGTSPVIAAYSRASIRS